MKRELHSLLMLMMLNIAFKFYHVGSYCITCNLNVGLNKSTDWVKT